MLVKKFMKLKTFLLILCLIFSILHTGRMYAMNILESFYVENGQLFYRLGMTNKNNGLLESAARYFAEAGWSFANAGGIGQIPPQTAAKYFQAAGWSFASAGGIGQLPPQTAAKYFAKAGQSLTAAGKLNYLVGMPEIAAVRFKQAGRSFTHVARQYLLAGRPPEDVAKCFNTAGRFYRLAGKLYNQAGQPEVAAVRFEDASNSFRYAGLQYYRARQPEASVAHQSLRQAGLHYRTKQLPAATPNLAAGQSYIWVRGRLYNNTRPTHSAQAIPPTFNVRSPDNQLETVAETETRKRSAGDDQVHDQPPPKRWRPWEE